MKLLVIGSGGREHAMVWKLQSSPLVTHIYVAPGNGGTAQMPGVTNVAIEDPLDLKDFALLQKIDLTIVGPEAPLSKGVVDVFKSSGLRIFGPSQAAAQLESSKDFAKQFMERHGIPTAAYQTFTDAQLAHQYIDAQGAPIVIKADGLAAGKGVVVAMTLDEAHAAVQSMLGDAKLGQAGARVVIESCLIGEEASFIVICDGTHIVPLATSQDHKRLTDGDLGPNTGGMGAYSPAPVVSSLIHDRLMKEVIEPTIQGMTDDGIPFQGFLYAGIMIGEGSDATRPIGVLEFNCRLGDPETQPIMMRLESDLVSLFMHATNVSLNQAEVIWNTRPAIGVVMASSGYPEKTVTGDVIHNIPLPNDDCVVFHAGTHFDENTTQTSGGRVLCVTALGDDLAQAQARAYQTVDQIKFKGAQFRRDIGWRALEPNKQ
jgi:phosphoribosylamine--glycine ligase